MEEETQKGIEDTLDLMIKQNKDNFDNIDNVLGILIEQNEKNNPNDSLDNILEHNDKVSKLLNQTIKEGIGNLHKVLYKLEGKDIDVSPVVEEIKNASSKIDNLLEFVKGKEDEKLSGILGEIKAELSKPKEVYSDSKVLEAVKRLTKEISDIDISFEFDFDKLSRLQNEQVKKIVSTIYQVNLDKYKEAKNAIAVKLYDKDGDVIERFGGGGGGYQDVRLKNVNQVAINPATEEKQDSIISAVNGITLDTSTLATETTLGNIKTQQTDGSQKTQIVTDLGTVGGFDNSGDIHLLVHDDIVDSTLSGIASNLTDVATETTLAALNTKIGEVQDVPTVNTVLNRLQTIGYYGTQSFLALSGISDILSSTGTYIKSNDLLECGGKIAVGVTQVEVTISANDPQTISIQADKDNTGTLYVGKTGVTSAGANALCFLEAGDSVSLDYDDTSPGGGLYIISDTAGQYFWKGAIY